MESQQRTKRLGLPTEIRMTGALTDEGRRKWNGYSMEHIVGDNHAASSEEGNAQC